uniref:PAM2 domain-containing protein n=1 Tax=Glossina brevipalpis TaxID=37001 RepID=A0A1A9WBW2_9MUSC
MSDHQLQEISFPVTNVIDDAKPIKTDEPALIYNKSIKPQRIIVTANGIKMQSNLNPNAKEFYPSYIKRERLKSGQDEYKIDELDGRKDDKKIEDTKPLEKSTEITTKECEEISTPKMGEARVENIVFEALNENSCKAETIEKLLGFSKLVEIIAADENKRAIVDKKTKDSKGGSTKQSEKKGEKDCKSEVGAKEKLHLFKSNAATKSKLNILKDSKEVIFVINSKEDILMKSSNMELPKFDTSNLPGSNEKDRSLIVVEDGSDRSTPNSIDGEADMAQSLLKESIEDVGDHSHKNESGINLQIQINHLSKSQTNIKPTITKEILDGMAPPASPTTEIYSHHTNLSTDRRKNLILYNLKKPKATKPSTVASPATKATVGVGLKKASTPERPNTSKESTVGTVNKDRNRIAAQTKAKTGSVDTKSIVTPATNNAIVKSALRNRTTVSHIKSNSEGVKKESSISNTKMAPTIASKDKSGSLTARASSQSSTTGKIINSSSTKNSEKLSSASTPSSLKSKNSGLKSARSTIPSTLRKTDTSKVN